MIGYFCFLNKWKLAIDCLAIYHSNILSHLTNYFVLDLNYFYLFTVTSGFLSSDLLHLFFLYSNKTYKSRQLQVQTNTQKKDQVKVRLKVRKTKSKLKPSLGQILSN